MHENSSFERELTLRSSGTGEEMLDNGRSPANILFFGFEEPLAAELQNALESGGRPADVKSVSTIPDCLRWLDEDGGDLIFCPADPKHYMALLWALRRRKPKLPVVVVSRYPQVSEWLDAIEAGAADYCAAPFESRQVDWILDNCLQSNRVAVA
jgi:DNA-binding NtrC family response regulator